MKILLDPGAFMPTRAYPTDAGLDICASEDAVIFPDTVKTVETGVHVEIPSGYVGLLTSKSGLMSKKGVTSRGTIDSGYTGAIRVMLINHGDRTLKIKAGDKISQLVILPIITPEIEVVDSLGKTARGSKGFGSTGR